jgi:hypothetical protein
MFIVDRCSKESVYAMPALSIKFTAGRLVRPAQLTTGRYSAAGMAGAGAFGLMRQRRRGSHGRPISKQTLRDLESLARGAKSFFGRSPFAATGRSFGC